MNKVSKFCTIVCALIALPAMAEDKPSATRTLDEINIEGAVDVPQVLFITSRDNVRFDDDMGWLYMPSAEEILASAILPSEVTPQDFPEFEVPDLINQKEPASAPDAKE